MISPDQNQSGLLLHFCHGNDELPNRAEIFFSLLQNCEIESNHELRVCTDQKAVLSVKLFNRQACQGVKSSAIVSIFPA
ncbi:hypothetical protein [Advenella kashmirensis]|uniref:hypothetical protein n=1 Tax=Advenella kashmirensis TaxID=310575 RepID=UPI0012DEF098|nr:hypothetical protein [Advenella kashmirensis]